MIRCYTFLWLGGYSAFFMHRMTSRIVQPCHSGM